MKKFTKIISLILSLVLAVSSLAALSVFAAPTAADTKTLVPDKALNGYIYVAYESEQKYKYDISDGVFDGIAFGESVILESASNKKSKTLSLPSTNVYIVALSDIETASGVYATIGDRQQISIDLNGHTLSMLGGFSVGASNSSLVSSELNIKNGVILLEGSIQAGKTNKMHQLISPRVGSKLSFENIILKNGTANSWGTLTYDGNAASVVFKNSVIDIGSNRPLFSLSPSYAGVNCNCKSCAENRAANGIAQLRSQFIFDNTTILSAKALISQQANNCQIGGGKCIAIVDVYFKNGTEIASASGNWESLFIFNMGAADYDGSEREIYVEEGTSFNKSEILDSSVGDRFNIYFVDKNGRDIGENKMTANSGITDFPHMLCTGTCDVEWYSYHDEAQLLETVTYAKGATPMRDAPAHDSPFSEEILGEPRIKQHSGWTYTKGQTTPDKISPLSESIKLYATYSDEPATFVLYDGSGAAIDGWNATVIDSAVVDKIVDGAALTLYSNATLAAQLPTDISYEIELRGYALTVASGESVFSVATPAQDKTVKLVGGTVYAEGAPALVDGGIGKIVLEDVKLRSVGTPAVIIGKGALEMTGGSLRTDLLGSELASGVVIDALANVDVSFFGTYLEVNNGTSSASIILVKPAADGTAVNLCIGADDGVMTTVAKCRSLLCADFSAASAKVELICDSVDLFKLGELAAFDNTADGERELVRIIARNAAIAAQNSGALAVSPEGIPLYSPADPTLPAVPVENVDIEAFTSLCIWRGLDVIIYVPTDSDITRVILGDSVAFDRTLADTCSTEIIEGRECYVAVCSYLAPSVALCDVTLTCFFAKDGAEYRRDTKYNLIDYCEDILFGDYADETRTLILDTLVYIRDAHLFFSTKIEEKDMKRINALIGEYEPAEVELDGVNTLSELSGLVKSVHFSAGATPSLTLTLTKAAMTKNIIVYSAHLLPVVVSAGEAEGTVTIELPLFALNDTVNIRIGDKTAQYSFAAYVSALSDGYASLGNSLTDACEALWRLGESARAYKNFKDGIGTPDTPIVSPK